MMCLVKYFSIFFLCLSINLISLAQVNTITLKPSTTDSRINTFDADNHKIYFSNGTQNRGLLIYLPASFYLTNSAELFCHTAAKLGYIVISLAYPGTDILYDACAHNTTLTCFEDIHREIIEGKNYNPFLKIDSTEGILYRLKAVLQYLKSNDKTIPWQDFLDENNNIKYANTTWAGHSDAAGRVAIIAKYMKVKRAILFSGPKDFSEHFYIPPAWMSTGTWKTDKSNIYAFGHGQDDFLIQQEIWDSLGLKKYGRIVNTEQAEPPYNNSRQLITTLNVAIADRHFCTVLDGSIPLVGGVPVFEPVWKYMLNDPLISTPIESFALSKVPKIFPNPAKAGEKLNIEIIPDIKYSLVSFTGKIVQSGTISQMNTTGIMPGVYLLKLQFHPSRESVQKLIIY